MRLPTITYLKRIALPVAFLALLSVARGDIHPHSAMDMDGVDTDGNGTVDDDYVSLHLAAGDGFINMADGRSLYIFGFQDLTGVDDHMAMTHGELGANAPAPTIIIDEGQRLFLTLSNVGMKIRPDLFDPHTVHWHGFPNAAPIFDGVPSASIAVNMGAAFTYFYNAVEPGTYMYHCHVEATEHMQMGMLGNLYVRAKQNHLPDLTDLNGFTHRTGYKYVYNDGDGSTRYDVEFPLQLAGFDPLFHDASEGVQPLPFATLNDTYPVINGRGYPDTIEPGPLANQNDGRLTQQVSSLITAEQGQRVLLRISSLSTTDYFTVTLLGIPMRVVGTGARLLRGPGGEDLSYETASVTLGGGENADVILDTTDVEPGTYFLYATNLNRLSNNEEDFGGAMTEIVVNEPGSVTAFAQALTPASGSTIDLADPQTFTWDYTGASAATFSIEVATATADLGNPALTLTFPKKPVAGTSHALSNSELAALKSYLSTRYAGSFAWRVVGRENASGVFHRSPANVVNVTIEDILPTSPANGSMHSIYTRPTFAFQYGGADLTAFRIELSNRSDFTGLTASTASAPGSPITLDAAAWRSVKSWFRKEPNPANRQFYWRVIGENADRTIRLASESRRLKLDGGTITLTAPADTAFASLGGQSPTFSWLDNVGPWVDPFGLAGKYVLELSSSPDFNPKVSWQSSKRGSSGLAMTVEDRVWSRLDKKLKVDPGTGSVLIYWRVLAMDQDLLVPTPSATVRTIRLTR